MSIARAAIVFAALIFLMPTRPAEAEVTSRDDFFPAAGDVTLTEAIGVPYLSVSEVSIGITPWFTTGVIFAVADEIGVGIRPRFSLYTLGPAQLAFAVPIVYYPPMTKRNGHDWIYANPQLRIDLMLPRGIRLYGGAGVVLAAYMESIAAALSSDNPASKPTENASWGAPPAAAAPPLAGGIWTTVHLGGGVPIARTVSVTLDGGLVLNGVNRRAEYTQRIGIPFLTELGIVKTF